MDEDAMQVPDEGASPDANPGGNVVETLLQHASSPSETRTSMLLAVLAGLLAGGASEQMGPEAVVTLVAAALGTDGLNRMSPYLTDEVRDYPWFFAAGVLGGWVSVRAASMHAVQ